MHESTSTNGLSGTSGSFDSSSGASGQPSASLFPFALSGVDPHASMSSPIQSPSVSVHEADQAVVQPAVALVHHAVDHVINTHVHPAVVPPAVAVDQAVAFVDHVHPAVAQPAVAVDQAVAQPAVALAHQPPSHPQAPHTPLLSLSF